jgi:hypothetical protein
MRGLGVLCLLDGTTIEHGSKDNTEGDDGDGRPDTQQRLGAGREPDGTDDRLRKKEKSGNAAGEVKRPEPTAEVIAEAIK